MTHNRASDEHHRQSGSVTARVGLGALAFAVGAATLSYLLLHPPAPDLLGSWVGRDSAGVEVVYHFDQDGSGFRVIGGSRESFRYVFTSGYPNGLTITVGPDSVTYRGIAEVGSRLRMEFGDPGAPAPRRLSDGALLLRRPPSR
jgi:hypothetical protein